LNLLVGTFLTTAMLILSTGVRAKVAVSSLAHALHHLSASSAHLLPVPVLLLVVVVEAALLIVALIIASGFTLVKATIVTTPMPILMLDSPASKASEDLLVPSASLVPLTPGALDLKPLFASNTLAVDLVAALSSLLTLTVSL